MIWKKHILNEYCIRFYTLLFCVLNVRKDEIFEAGSDSPFTTAHIYRFNNKQSIFLRTTYLERKSEWFYVWIEQSMILMVYELYLQLTDIHIHKREHTTQNETSNWIWKIRIESFLLEIDISSNFRLILVQLQLRYLLYFTFPSHRPIVFPTINSNDGSKFRRTTRGIQGEPDSGTDSSVRYIQ